MTNDETNPNDRNPMYRLLSFVLCHSFDIRHSCFVIEGVTNCKRAA